MDMIKACTLDENGNLFHLDKDLLQQGVVDKIYSPDKYQKSICIF